VNEHTNQPEGTFHNPALRQDCQALYGIQALLTISSVVRFAQGIPLGPFLTLIGPIRDHPLQKREEPSHLQDTQATIPILHLAEQNGTAEHQAECIDEGVALTPFNPLSRFIASG
jgi:hypothetical protein